MSEKSFNKVKYDNDYRKRNYKTLSINIRINEYENIKEHIEKTGENNTQFIKRAIKETMENDNNKNNKEI